MPDSPNNTRVRPARPAKAESANDYAPEVWSWFAVRFSLSERETQLAQLVIHELPLKKIARQLQISYGTVKKEAGALYRKMQVHSRLGVADKLRAAHLQYLLGNTGDYPPLSELLAIIRTDHCNRDFSGYDPTELRHDVAWLAIPSQGWRPRQPGGVIRFQFSRGETPMFGAWAMRGLGGLLLLAAALKMYGLAVAPVGRAGIFSEPWVQIVILEWEITLGVWLLTGRYRSAAWLATIATFVVFACINFWQGWLGQGSCGCFGKIHVNPWLTLGIDAGALVSLTLCRRHAFASETLGEFATWLRPVAIGIGAVAILLGIIAGIGTISFGSPAAALASLRGERLSIQPRLVDVGDVEMGQRKEAIFDVQNWTDKPIRLVGGTSDCSCVVTKDLPMTIPAGESCSLTISIASKGHAGQFTRSVFLFTDDEQLPKVQFRVTGQSHALQEE